MEIGLLRNGRRVPIRQALPPASYFVFLSRAEHRPLTDVWPVELDAPLPTVPVPLLPGDADVELDFQTALASVYDLFSYDLAVNYTRPPDPPLRPDQAAWALERLGIPSAVPIEILGECWLGGVVMGCMSRCSFGS